MKIHEEEPCPCGSGDTYGRCHASHRTTAPSRGLRPVALTVIPEPDPGMRAVLEHIGEGTIIFQGVDGPDELDCGTCGAPLGVGVHRGQFAGIVLRCSSCRAFNDT